MQVKLTPQQESKIQNKKIPEVGKLLKPLLHKSHKKWNITEENLFRKKSERIMFIKNILNHE